MKNNTTHSQERESNDSLKQYLDSLAEYPPLGSKEERRLGLLSLGGDKSARDTLCQHNLLLVYSIALRYKSSGVDMLDLIQEGNLGLLRAVETFDPTKGRLSTHASFWIESCLRKATRSNAPMKLPANMYYQRKKVQQAETSLYADLARTPTEEEISSFCGITAKELAQVRAIPSVASLDAQQGALESDGEPVALKDAIADHAPTTDQEVVTDLRAKEIRQIMLYVLSDEERTVIELRFGIHSGQSGLWDSDEDDDDDGELSFHQIAQRIGRSHAKTLSLYREALKKLRAAMKLTAFAA